MTTLLTDNLPLLAGAPNGIKKVRELILELAVRGKLLAQNPDDEPACQLLKRIAKEKVRLEIVGQIRKQKPLSQIAEDEQPFELPEGWAWTRLADVAFSQAGFAFKSNGFNQAGLGLPLIRIRDVGQVFSGTYYEGNYRPEFLVQHGDYLISMDGEFRVAAWEGEASLLNQRVSRLIFFGEEIARRFIADSLQARLLELQGVKAYTTVDHLSGGQISASVIALPPLAEQHRIVAKVDELMALCDRLEAQQADAESAHTQLVQALLDSLTQAGDATDFAANWQRLVEHFHTLFTTEPSIDALKQTLLQLAVMGKLVPQDPSDEPSSELLKRVAEEKALLVAEGKIRKTKQLPEITDEERSFAPPNGWEVVRFGQVIALVSGQHLGPDEYFESARDGAIPYLTGPADFGETYPRPTRFTHERRATSIKGDILLTVKGSGVGKTNFVNQQELAISRQLMAIRPILVDVQFARNMLFSMSEHFQSKSIGIAIPGISREDVLDTLIGLPPLPEQHRIVAKVDQLMALCDQLKTRLTQAHQLNEQLASTLVEQAVA